MLKNESSDQIKYIFFLEDKYAIDLYAILYDILEN